MTAKRFCLVAAAALTFTGISSGAAVAATVPAAVQAAPARAVSLKLSAATRSKLADAYWRSSKSFKRSMVDGPKHVYYGKIIKAGAKNVYWAVGDIGVKGDPVSFQDGPHIWRKNGSGPWVHLGDTGGDLSRVPSILRKLWKLS
jgi:hypothetical protein